MIDDKNIDSELAADEENVDLNLKNMFHRRFAPSQTNTMEIKTIREGYNSGRTYYLRSKIDADSRKLIESLSSLAKNARRKAEARSQLEMVQLKFRNFYNSSSFQAIIVLLITTV